VLAGNSIYASDHVGVFGNGGAMGSYALEVTDDVTADGDLIATGSYFAALELGDESVIKGQCVTGGGLISNNHTKPAVCKGGYDDTGTSPLLTDVANALADADTLRSDLLAMTPTLTLLDLDILQNAKTVMQFNQGVNVVAVGTRFLVESGSKLTIDAPAGASVIFLITGDLSIGFQAKVKLSGGIKEDSVAYVVSDEALLGVESSIPGTILAGTGNCLTYHKAKITGALMCNQAISLASKTKVTYKPLRSVFP
jgi:hypothetical protein